jgi:hypothetical protein
MANVALALTADQALVLFDILAELSDGSRMRISLNEAEKGVLNHLEASLEAVLVEPFKENYRELVLQAHARLVSESDT